MSWIVEIGDEFEPEFDELHEDVRTEILALTRLLQQFGPQLGRPRVDTLNNSRHANMKELRFSAADGEWRVAFAFDTKRKAILLVAGDKSGVSEKQFYRALIRRADERFNAHLARLKPHRAGRPPSQEEGPSGTRPGSVVRRVPQKRKGCGAHHQSGQEQDRAALRFARVPQKKERK